MEDTARERKALPRDNRGHARAGSAVVRACVGTRGKHLCKVQEQDGRVFRRDHVDHEGLVGHSRIRLAEHPSSPFHAEHAHVAPDVDAFDAHTALEDEPHRRDDIAHPMDSRTFLVAAFARCKASEHRPDFLGIRAAEQLRRRQKLALFHDSPIRRRTL